MTETPPTNVHNIRDYERRPHSHIVRRVNDKAERAFWKGGKKQIRPIGEFSDWKIAFQGETVLHADDLSMGHTDPEMAWPDSGDQTA